jgi:ADP-ribose pyrophosphatase YjhB (NUDIX family)
MKPAALSADPDLAARHGYDREMARREPAGGGTSASGRPAGRPLVNETSAGGLVFSTRDGVVQGVLIGRRDRRGVLRWLLPKGHVEAGETVADTAIREVAEETGISGHIVAELGTVDFWFTAPDRRVHKTVHHYLISADGGELSSADVEVDEVAWVPLDEMASRLSYDDERRLVEQVPSLLDNGE